MNDKEKKPGNPWTKSLLIWVGVLFVLVLFVQMIDGGSKAQAGGQTRGKAQKSTTPRKAGGS